MQGAVIQILDHCLSYRQCAGPTNPSKIRVKA